LSGSLLKEARKLEVRLEEFVKEEDSFIEALRRLIDKIRELNLKIEGVRREGGNLTELKDLRHETFILFSEALRKEGEAEHERSHLLGSYGSLLLALEEEFKAITEE